MRVIKPSNQNSKSKALLVRAEDVAIEERLCDIAIRKRLLNFHMAKEAFCILCLIVMLTLVLLGRVSNEVFFISQLINGIIKGRGKGLQTVTESEFPKKD